MIGSLVSNPGSEISILSPEFEYGDGDFTFKLYSTPKIIKDPLEVFTGK